MQILKTDNMQLVSFFLKPRAFVKEDGTSLIYLHLRIDGVVKEINTGEHVNRKLWDFKRRCLKTTGKNKTSLLEQSLVHEKILETCRKISLQAKKIGNHSLTHESFLRELKASGKTFDLIKFTRKFIAENPLSWSRATVHSYEGLCTILTQAYKTTITAGDVPGIRERMQKYLSQKGDSPNTIIKRQKQIKSMLKRARKDGFLLPDPYQDPIGTVKGHRHFLNLEEVKDTIELYNSNSLPPNLQDTLGQFLFSCFTGCRYSDIKELTHKNIVGDLLEYVAVKTARFNKVVQAPLPDVARVMITHRLGRLFEMKTGQVVNRHLARIFKMLGINKHITFHCARHTFGTLYIYLGGDITNLQQIMAHSHIDTTMEYVRLAKRLEAHDLRLFDTAFAEKMGVITKGQALWRKV